MYHILVVDDEEYIRRLIAKFAVYEGHTVTEAADGMEAVRLCRENQYDIMIIDIMMPELDGFSACREIRKFSQIPIIMLSARGEEYDKINGFELGIDDYVVKPFDRKILLARVKAVLRRGLPVTEGRDFDGLRIDEPSRTATLRGKVLDLTAGEFSLLTRLVAHRGRVFARPPDERTVDVQVANLRRKLGRWGDHIETVRGVGYRISEFDQ